MPVTPVPSVGTKILTFSDALTSASPPHSSPLYLAWHAAPPGALPAGAAPNLGLLPSPIGLGGDVMIVNWGHSAAPKASALVG